MDYIKHKAKDYKQALQELRSKYGEDVIVISHKYVKEGGLLNTRVFAKDVCEVTAAIHNRKSKKTEAPASRRSGFDMKVGGDIPSGLYSMDREPQSAPRAAASRPVAEEPVSDLAQAMGRLNDARAFADMLGKATGRDDIALNQPRAAAAEPVERPVAAKPQQTPAADDRQFERFEKEFEDLKRTIQRLVENGQGAQAASASPAVNADEAGLEHARTILRKNEFDDDEAGHVLNEVRNSVSREDLKDKTRIEKSLKDLLKSRIVTSGPIVTGPRKKIIMFVGPTGVGKTTSLAKMGAIYALREGKRVAFVTIDTYRIAATEQLKKYAEIMKIPIHVVNDQKEFKQVIEAEKAEIILVDTSGRSHKNRLKISEIKSYAEQVDFDFEKILCVSASTKKEDVHSVFRAFSVMDISSVMITKIDETSFVGNVVDVADKYNKPISYVTNGQEVPNDIDVADPDKLVELMIYGNQQL